MKFPINVARGLNLDAIPSELEPGFCSGDTDNVRFRNGSAEKVGGLLEYEYRSSEVPVWCSLFPLSNGVATSGAFLIFASEDKAYCRDLSTSLVVDLTRYTEGKEITSITRVGTTATLTTAAAHGRTTGNTVSVWGASPSQYNGTFTITVTSTTTFTYTMTSDPGASASPVGLYSYDGARSNFTSDILTAAAQVEIPQQYSGGPFNGVFLLNSPADGLYYWAGVDATVPFRRVPNAYKARVSRSFGNYVIQLAPTVDGTEFTRRVVWSSASEPGTIPTSFSATATNDAGFVELAESGELVDCLPLGDTLIIYARDARYAMRYVGGQSVFEFTKLPGSDGLFCRGAVADTPVGHVFVSGGQQVMVHAGGTTRDISKGRIGDYLKTSGFLNFTAFVVQHAEKGEVWIAVPVLSTFPNTIFIWNWVDDVFGKKTFASSTTSSNPRGIGLTSGACGVPGTWQSYAMTFVTGISSSEASGYVCISTDQPIDFGTSGGGGQAVNAVLEVRGLDLGDRDTIKNLQRSRWNIDPRPFSTIQVSHGSSMSADADPTYSTAQTYTPGTTDYINARAPAGRFVAVKITMSDSGAGSQITKVRSADLDVTFGGKR